VDIVPPTHSDSAPVVNSRTTSFHHLPTSRDIVAAWRARLARRYRIPSQPMPRN
jgi:hypothetical protein